MIKISIFLIFIFHIVDANLYQFYNFSMNPENSQPSGSINYNHIFFRKNYKSYALENNNNNNFGKSITFSPLNDLCHNDFEKYQNVSCKWWCIYDNCISPSKNTINYIHIPIKFNYFIIEKEFELPYAY
jgi:hypothetical protein